MAPPATTTFTARWADVSGLRTHMYTSDALRRSPLFLGLLAANWAAFGSPVSSPLGCALLAAFSYGVQRAFAYVVGLLTMPGGRETLRWIRSARESAFLARFIPLEGLQGVLEHLTRLDALLDSARVQMLDSSRAALGSAESVTLTTPDGGHVDGVLLGGDRLRAMVAAARGSAEGDERGGCRGVILYLGGNAEHYEVRADLVKEWGRDRKFSLLFMNYRGVGRSGSPGDACTRDGGVLDVVSCLAYLTTSLRVPANRVVVMGHSIGGGYSTEAARFFPGVLCINDRSFSSLSAVAMHHVAAPLVEGSTAGTAWATLGRALFTFVFRHVACWELDAALHWSHIGRDCKLLVFSGEDQVIPPPSQLAAGLLARPALLQPNGLGAVLDMEPRGSGTDAHNGGWTRSENARLDAGISKFLRGHPLGDVL